MPLVAGVDSSTQSVKVVVRDAHTGEAVRSGRAPHPDGTQCPPSAWWAALQQASDGLMDGVQAIGRGRAAARHGGPGRGRRVVRPAMLWNDTSSAPDAADLVDELGGPQAWAEAVGSVPVAQFHRDQAAVAGPPGTCQRRPDAPGAAAARLAHLAAGRPARRRRPLTVATPRAPVTGRRRPAPTDRTCSSWRLGRTSDVPRVAAPAEPVGRTAFGALLAPGTGDNMACRARARAAGRRRRGVAGDLRHRICGRGPASADPSGQSPGSPTPPAASCRWSPPRTPRGCWPPAPACSASARPSSTHWR